MCLSPISIKNLNKGLAHKGLNYLKDCESSYIGVPCGHCAECIRKKQMDYIQRVQMESIDSYQYMLTLTYNEYLPVVTTSTGYSIRYASVDDVQKMFKRFREYNILRFPFRYIGVNELGTTRGRPHFHFLLFFKKSDIGDFNQALSFEQFLFPTILKNWARNYGSKRNPNYVPLTNFKECFRNGRLHRNYDLHLIVPLDGVSDDAAAWYCLKYMLKPSDRAVRLQRALHLNLSEDDYNKIWSLVKPRIIKSLGFGLCASVIGRASDRVVLHDSKIVSYLKKCIKDTPEDSPFPFFYNRFDGSNYPLATYFKRQGDIFSVSDAHTFFYMGNPKYFDKSFDEIKQKIKHYEKIIRIADDTIFVE